MTKGDLKKELTEEQKLEILNRNQSKTFLQKLKVICEDFFIKFQFQLIIIMGILVLLEGKHIDYFVAMFFSTLICIFVGYKKTFKRK